MGKQKSNLKANNSVDLTLHLGAAHWAVDHISHQSKTGPLSSYTKRASRITHRRSGLSDFA